MIIQRLRPFKKRLKEFGVSQKPNQPVEKVQVISSFYLWYTEFERK
jgi:hypothetical protein